jgi:hypothetical protein
MVCSTVIPSSVFRSSISTATDDSRLAAQWKSLTLSRTTIGSSGWTNAQHRAILAWGVIAILLGSGSVRSFSMASNGLGLCRRPAPALFPVAASRPDELRFGPASKRPLLPLSSLRAECRRVRATPPVPDPSQTVLTSPGRDAGK